jgi:hypothetical protein
MRLLILLLSIPLAATGLALGCSGSGSSPSANPDAGDSSSQQDAGGDRGPVDAKADGPSRDASAADVEGGASPKTLDLECAATTSAPNPNPCPAPSGASGEADFCYRAEWAGVTGVEVYGGFGQSTDWKMPFVTLTNDGTGTFTGKASLAKGSYPYVFRTTGSADHLVSSGHYFLDQENTDFEPAPAGAPDKRSVSVVSVPQGAASPLVHIKGTVLYEGHPQSCFSVDLEAGELTKGSKVVSEHDTANYTESASDGTFDFPVAANAPYMVVVRFPFLLAGADAGYPDPSTTPSVGVARTNITVGGADVTLGSTEISYPLSDYAAMSPTGGTATLPVTFKFTLVPGSTGAQMSVTSTDIAGNDPAYASGYSTSTSVAWDGGFNGSSGDVKLGTTYYWGAWQQRAAGAGPDGGVTWTEESFLFPIAFH